MKIKYKTKNTNKIMNKGKKSSYKMSLLDKDISLFTHHQLSTSNIIVF